MIMPRTELCASVTFLKVSLASLDVTWKAGHASLVISLPRGLKLNTNDLGGQFHRKLTSLRVPQVFVKILLASQSEQSSWLEAAEFAGDGHLDIYSSPAGWQEKAQEQAEFIEQEDSLTGRATRMFGILRPDNSSECQM